MRNSDLSPRKPFLAATWTVVAGPQKAMLVGSCLDWSGDYGLDLFNTWNLSCEEQKLDEYWKRYEEHVKPQSNHILYYFYLRNIKQNGRALNDFLTEAKLLI